jgi:hypothetical protein
MCCFFSVCRDCCMRDDLFVVELVAPEIAVCRACLFHQRCLFSELVCCIRDGCFLDQKLWMHLFAVKCVHVRSILLSMCSYTGGAGCKWYRCSGTADGEGLVFDRAVGCGGWWWAKCETWETETCPSCLASKKGNQQAIRELGNF